MKNIKRFYDEDLRNLIIETYNLKPSQVTPIYTEEYYYYGQAEYIEPVFYIEVDESE